MKNVKIKTFQGKPATNKVQIIDPDAMVEAHPDYDGDKCKARERGYRALEEGEVVSLEDGLVSTLMKATDVLEITEEEATRPLFFDDIDPFLGAGLAQVTSKRYNTDSPERAKDQKEAKEKVAEGMKKRKPRKKVETDS